MRLNEKSLVVAGIIFFLLLASYKFSLLHETAQLAYLAEPSILPFQRLFTYVFMMIGIIPTALLMLYTGIACSTTYPSGVVQFMCFGSPFAMGDTTGFFAYIVASLVTTVFLFYLFSVFVPPPHNPRVGK